jgi:hypothetical protein
MRHVLVGDNEVVVDEILSIDGDFVTGWDDGKFDTDGLDEDDGIADIVGEYVGG